jgi:Domain of unknown function (DUF4185)
MRDWSSQGSGREEAVRSGVRVLALLVAVALGVFELTASDGSIAPRAAAAIPVGPPAGLLANSTQAVCALTGTHGTYTELPPDYTANVYGINSGDAGSSFEFGGQVWWLFGNSGAATSAPWTQTNARSRWSTNSTNPALLGSDAIATSPITTAPTPVAPYSDTEVPPNQQCPVLTFAPKSGSKAYANPSVFSDPLFPGQSLGVSLRIGELPETGVGEGNNIYVVFGTDNPANCAALIPAPPHGPAPALAPGPCPQPAPHHKAAKICGIAKVKGSRTRSLMAVRTGTGVTFKGLYDLSPAPPIPPAAPYPRYEPRCPTLLPSDDPARFVNVQMANGTDGYVYIWGTEGGANDNVSPVYLARMLAANIATGKGIAYWDGHRFSPGPQSAAAPLFTDVPNACASQLGIQDNPYLHEWIMLYRCNEDPAPPGHPNGIYMRTAPLPSGPWSAPTTIFNPAPDPRTQSGFCYFIYSTNKCKATASNKGLLGSQAASLSLLAANLGISIHLVSKHPGSYYGPYFVADWTTGTYANYPTRARTTIYYTLDTFDPYGQLILRSTILGPPVTPSCTGAGTPCG